MHLYFNIVRPERLVQTGLWLQQLRISMLQKTDKGNQCISAKSGDCIIYIRYMTIYWKDFDCTSKLIKAGVNFKKNFI